jgi:membrane-bound serine protease (ClpP class)
MESPILADFEDSAVRNHHDPLLADAMVDVKAEVYWVQNPAGGERRFVDAKTYAKLTGEGWKTVEGASNPVDSADRLLTVSTPMAVKLGLASGQAASAVALGQARGWNVGEQLDSGMGETIVAMLNSGWLRMLLITVFGTAVYAALHAPGHGAAEAIAVTSLGLLLGVPLLAGYATWWEIGLILGGLALIAFEVFVFPHTGLMVLAGVVMMAFGLVMTFVGTEPGRSPLSPQLPGTWAGLKNGIFYVTGGLVGAAVVSWWISRFLPKIPYFGRIVLADTAGRAATDVVPTPPVGWPVAGAVGRAVTPLKPGGSAEFPDASGADVKVFSVVSESGYLPAGAPVVVRESGGGRVVVRSTV